MKLKKNYFRLFNCILLLLFYLCTYQSMAAINIVGQRAEEEIDIDNVPPPSPELVPPPPPELVPPHPPSFCRRTVRCRIPDNRMCTVSLLVLRNRHRKILHRGRKLYTCLHPKRLYSLTLLSVNLLR